MAGLKQDEKELLDLILKHDDTALARLFDYCGWHFIEYFQSKYPNFQVEVHDEVTDSLVNFIQNPGNFDPEKSAIKTYLQMDISGNLSNRFRDLQRHQKKFLSNSVELDAGLGNIKSEENPDKTILDVEDGIAVEKINQRLKDKLATIFPDPIDYEIAWLIEVERKRDTDAYASLLGIERLDKEAKEAEVKKAKDRIKAKLKRSDFAAFKARMRKEYES